MPEDKAVNIDIRTKDNGAKAGISGVLGELQKLLGEVPGVGSALGALGTATAALGATFAVAARAVSEFAGAQKGVAQLDAALGRAGQLTDEYRERLQDLATELANATAIADDEWLAVLTRLTQFGAKPETIGMDAEAVKNLAGIVGDLGTAATLYSKALQGNFEMLGRYGIVVSKTGTQAEKLNELWLQLAQRGGGQLEARAESLSGKFENLKNQIGEVFEAVGGHIAKATELGDVIEFVAGAFEYWAEELGGAIAKLPAAQNATVQATKATSDYAVQLALVAQLAEKISKATDEETSAIKRKQSALDEIADAQMALDLARVDDAVKSGKMTAVQGIGARATIRRSAAKAKLDRDEAADLATMDANERGLADELQVRQQLVSRRDALKKQIGEGSIAESRATMAQKTIKQLLTVKESIENGGETLWDRLPGMVGGIVGGPILGPVGKALGSAIGARDRERSLAEVTRAIEIAQRIGPASLTERRKELNAMDDTIGRMDQDIFQRRGAVLTQNTTLAEGIERRRVVYGLNQERDAVVTGGETRQARQAAAEDAVSRLEHGLTPTNQAVGTALNRILGSANATLRYAEVSAATHVRVEQRLRVLETQVKGTSNR